jgi:hypothetical protein
VAGKARTRAVAMAEAALNDGQRLLAFNDFLIGCRSHVSARDRLTWRGQSEVQSSSGVIVSTGAGSTGWLSSTRHIAVAVSRFLGAEIAVPTLWMPWDDPRLAIVVREPFASRSSGVTLAVGFLEAGEELRIESYTPDGGVIFSDGVEADALPFNAGAVATVRVADRPTLLVRPAYDCSV